MPLSSCLIPKALFKNLGMVRDMKQRETLRRTDDESKKALFGHSLGNHLQK